MKSLAMNSNSIMLFLILLVQITPLASADHEVEKGNLEENTLKWFNMEKHMRDEHWEVADIEIVRYGMTTFFTRKGKLVGYCVVQSDKHKIKADDRVFENLNGVTRVILGDDTVNNIKFTITDKNELSIWVDACKNHMWVKSVYLLFVPLVEDAPIRNDRIDVGGAHGCNYGLHFYNADGKVFYYPFHEGQNVDSKEMANPLLESLILKQISKP